MAIQVNMVQAHDMIVRALQAKLVPFLAGSPGCGKSDLFKKIAEQFNLKLIDFRLAQCDPTDLLGFPHIFEVPLYVWDSATGKMKDSGKTAKRAGYIPMETFPLEGDPLPTEVRKDEHGQEYVHQFAGWLLLMDEMNHADRSVQKASYKVFLDKQVGARNIHPNCAIACAGNLDTDNAMVEEMSTALQSRLVHLELAVDVEQWIEWATTHDIDHRITSYIKYKPGNLYRFNPDHDDKTYASPRTWEFCSRIIKDVEKIERDLMPLLAGTVSEGVAREFYGYCQIYRQLLTVPQIVADPTGVHVPSEPDVLYALTGTIAHNATEGNIANLMQFVQRVPVEFQVTCLREIVRRKKPLLQNKAVQDWVTRNATELF